MATNVILPALGMAQDTGKIVEWLKAEGEHVTAGEPLLVIETDKSAVDLEAPASGILADVTAAAGDEVPVAQIIAVILSTEEAAARGTSRASGPVNVAVLATAGEAAAPQPQSTTSWIAGGAAVPAMSANGRRLASPKARRIAVERGVDLTAIRGTGPGGVVLAADVLAMPAEAQSMQQHPPAPATSTPAPVSPTVSPTEGSAVSTVWRLMAERTTHSWTTVPHFFLVREVVASRLIAWHERAQRQASAKITYTDLFVKIVAEALRRHPRLNASWVNGTVVPNADINVGLAVATGDGLVVPVIHQADDLSLNGIAKRRTDLVARAQSGKLRLSELQGGTFTISNLGMYGIDAFNAIINAPQAAILAVGRLADRVAPVNGQPVVQPMMTLSLSCDHRVVDGARGAQFLATIAALIEDAPELPE